MMVALEIILPELNIELGLITIACDNDTALERCLDEDWLVGKSPDNWDIHRNVRALKQQSCIRYIPLKVQGHKDKTSYTIDLTTVEKLNVQVDDTFTRNVFLRVISIEGKIQSITCFDDK